MTKGRKGAKEESVALRFSLRKCGVLRRLLDADIVSRVSLRHTYIHTYTYIHFRHAYSMHTGVGTPCRKRAAAKEPGRRLRSIHNAKARYRISNPLTKSRCLNIDSRAASARETLYLNKYQLITLDKLTA